VFGTLRLESMVAQQGPSEAMLLSAMRTGGSADGTLIFGWLPGWGALFQPLGMVLFWSPRWPRSARAVRHPEGGARSSATSSSTRASRAPVLIAEFAEVVVVAGIVTAIFLGGYHIPWF